ncbi:hypothetical protein FA15DRAFT_597971, partial [Coprinopsis marcescibilis]
DEDFDESYDNLLSLAAGIGEVRPRGTPANIVESLQSAIYKDMANTESDTRCPICLDDYGEMDPVLKLNQCPHWMHKECLQQWLQNASTCPVCRNNVIPPRTRGSPGPSSVASRAAVMATHMRRLRAAETAFEQQYIGASSARPPTSGTAGSFNHPSTISRAGPSGQTSSSGPPRERNNQGPGPTSGSTNGNGNNNTNPPGPPSSSGAGANGGFYRDFFLSFD